MRLTTSPMRCAAVASPSTLRLAVRAFSVTSLTMRLAVDTRSPMSPTETASSSAVAATVCTLAEASSDADATAVTRSLVSEATFDSTRAVSSIVRALSAKAPRMPAIEPRN
jgi:hypothetical protein